jgi:hypothetical protein
MENKVYIVIKNGNEGCEEILFASKDENLVKGRIEELNSEILRAKDRMENILSEHGEEDDDEGYDYYDRLYIKKEIKRDEYYMAKFTPLNAYSYIELDLI